MNLSGRLDVPPKRRQQIEQLYHAALERLPDDRAAFLSESCAGDSSLRREVEELLRYDGAAESFIEGNALAFEARRLEPEELSRTAPQLLPGQSIGAYKILALLGRGGMGVVYRARDERLRRDVAIKVLPASPANNIDRLRRFEQEAHATSALNHPNILTIYDIGAASPELGGAPFIVAELLEGEELRKQLNEGALPVRSVIDYAQQIASGLAAAHRADIFSFGMILYEMLSGKRPFNGASVADVMSAILKEEPPELGESNAKISPALEKIVRRCLEKKPERRFQTASDLGFALEA